MIVMSNPLYDAEVSREGLRNNKANLLIDQYSEGLDTVRRKFRQTRTKPKQAR